MNSTGIMKLLFINVFKNCTGNEDVHPKTLLNYSETSSHSSSVMHFNSSTIQFLWSWASSVGVQVYPFKIFLSWQRISCAPQSGGFHYTCTLL